MAFVPDSLPEESLSQRYNDYGLEATQLSQPVYSQQASQFANSQVEPRRKYWAILIPTNPKHDILKLPWSRTKLQIGRGNHVEVGNNVILQEKRVSNRHCCISLGLHGTGGPSKAQSAVAQTALVQALKDGEAEPEVWIEDLKSSNGTFVNGIRIQPRRMLVHGDEISLGHVGTADNHEVRYIFRSVGCKGDRVGEKNNAGEVYERYQMLTTLGKGTFAEVKKAVDVETGDLRAIKQIVKHRFDNNQKTLDLFQREIDICMQLHHENICRLLDSYSDPQHICLVLEFVDGGDLLDFIMNYDGDGLGEQEAADLTFQICRAMAYCHDRGVTHRDLKPENILLTSETPTQGRIIKIADFGLAKMVHTQTMLVSMVGTPQYLAPEVVMQTKSKPGYENVVDSWSIGIIVYSMLTKALPFDDSPELSMEQRIRQRYHMAFDREPLHALNVSDQAIDFIARLLDKEPSTRMTMAEALDHEWLAGPSSLPNESPSQVLGGDSMWNIQSFESSYDDFDGEGYVSNDDDQRTNGAWSRPMTASMTNLESGGSGESFSQPMEALRLGTATAQVPDMNGGGGGEDEEMASADGVTDDAPSVADTSVEVTNGNGPNGILTPPVTASASVSASTSAMDVDASSASTATATATKRKTDWFSSGSLSPPPPSPPRERETTPRPEPRRLTRAATAKKAKESPPKPSAAEDDASSTPKGRTRVKALAADGPRPRKSKRLG